MAAGVVIKSKIFVRRIGSVLTGKRLSSQEHSMLFCKSRGRYHLHGQKRFSERRRGERGGRWKIEACSKSVPRLVARWQSVMFLDAHDDDRASPWCIQQVRFTAHRLHQARPREYDKDAWEAYN
ncbi:hypothetical protein SCHPADRAFT_548882 [Schizopora paradoxa]|uniref:Uncharacterized protein n=1 Tax=Schizopora paradoxa TaxID=27342 RepID=A0A0H2RDD7_9AGAM|nr:hypothetical protein SCHPADRAFT_548882 [Schizopora paradoxa]